MRRVVDAYLGIYLVGSVAIVVGFTAAGAVPPRWLLAAFLPFLLAALASVVWLVRQVALAKKIASDRPLELAD